MERLSIKIMLFTLLLQGCSPYTHKNKRHYVIKQSYNENEVIYLENYVLCSTSRNTWKVEPIEINEDSLISIFKASLENLDVLIQYNPDKQNYCDSTFWQNPNLYAKKIDENKIIEIANSKNGELKMVPVINIDNSFRSHFFITPSRATGEGRYVDKFLIILIYLVRGEEIIYFKSMFYGESKESHLSILNHVHQENWDKLVELVMRDYIKRLK